MKKPNLTHYIYRIRLFICNLFFKDIIDGIVEDTIESMDQLYQDRLDKK